MNATLIMMKQVLDGESCLVIKSGHLDTCMLSSSKYVWALSNRSDRCVDPSPCAKSFSMQVEEEIGAHRTKSCERYPVTVEWSIVYCHEEKDLFLKRNGKFDVASSVNLLHEHVIKSSKHDIEDAFLPIQRRKSLRSRVTLKPKDRKLEGCEFWACSM